jgi:hypothetical protein
MNLIFPRSPKDKPADHLPVYGLNVSLLGIGNTMKPETVLLVTYRVVVLLILAGLVFVADRLVVINANLYAELASIKSDTIAIGQQNLELQNQNILLRRQLCNAMDTGRCSDANTGR